MSFTVNSPVSSLQPRLWPAMFIPAASPLTGYDIAPVYVTPSARMSPFGAWNWALQYTPSFP